MSTKHSFLKNVTMIINNKWAKLDDEIFVNHLGCPPDYLDEEVVRNMTLSRFLISQKIDSLLVLAGFIDIPSLGVSALYIVPPIPLL